MGNFGMLLILTTLVAVKKNGTVVRHQRHADIDGMK